MNRKTMKKFFTGIFTAVFAFSVFAATASAAEIPYADAIEENISSVENWVLTEENNYELDDGWVVSVKGYSADEDSEYGIEAQNAESGSKKLKYYCKFSLSAVGQTWDWLELWVWGNFHWDGETAWVTECDSRRNILHSHATIVSDTGTVHNDDQGSNFLFGNKYANVYRTVVMHNGSEINKTLELYVSVNRNGKVNVSPNSAEAV